MTSANFNGVRLNMRIMPADGAAAGGDWCESFVISDDVIALSIGDICGHGIEKVEAMTLTRQAIRDAANAGADPAQILAAANRFLRGYDPQENATALFALLNTREQTLSFANAGHPPPLMADPLGTRYLAFDESDLPLGIEAEIEPAVRTVIVPAGTLLVLYTDGVIESERRPLHGETELREAVTFAYQFSALSTATVIEERLLMTESNRDDAAILTAWMPYAGMSKTTKRRLARQSIQQIS